MALLVLPVVIVSSRESLRAVPLSLRETAFALGAAKYQVIFGQILPVAIAWNFDRNYFVYRKGAW